MPRRTLSWEDVINSTSITVLLCKDVGIEGESLKALQPDVQMWIQYKQVSMNDVPLMLAWPLHPVYDLHANVDDLAASHYAPSVLRKLGITYDFLRTFMHMDDDWMRIMRYNPSEWAEIGFSREDVYAMGARRIQWVFSLNLDAVMLQVSSVDVHHLT